MTLLFGSFIFYSEGRNLADLHKNFAYSTVATAPSPASSGTSLVVAAGQGALFPTPPFNATIWPVGTNPTSTNAEIVRVTGVSTDTFTITRSAESTAARTVIVGDQIANTITNQTLTDAEPAPIRVYQNIPYLNLTRLGVATKFSKRPFLVPFEMRASMSQMRSMELLFERSSGTSLNMTGGVAIYFRTNATQLSLMASESFNISLTTSAQYSGLRMFEISLTSMSTAQLSMGNYWLGVYLNGSNDSTAVMQLNLWGQSNSPIVGYVSKGANNTGATNQTAHFYDFAGSYSNTLATNAMFPATINSTQISGAGSADAPLLYFQILS